MPINKELETTTRAKNMSNEWLLTSLRIRRWQRSQRLSFLLADPCKCDAKVKHLNISQHKITWYHMHAISCNTYMSLWQASAHHAWLQPSVRNYIALDFVRPAWLAWRHFVKTQDRTSRSTPGGITNEKTHKWNQMATKFVCLHLDTVGTSKYSSRYCTSPCLSHSYIISNHKSIETHGMLWAPQSFPRRAPGWGSLPRRQLFAAVPGQLQWRYGRPAEANTPKNNFWKTSSLKGLGKGMEVWMKYDMI